MMVSVATAKSTLAQCRKVDLANLKLEKYPIYEHDWQWVIKDLTNEWWYSFEIDEDEIPKRFFSVLQNFKVKTICHVPAAGYVFHPDTLNDALLLTEDGKAIKGDMFPKSPYEQCEAFKPGNLKITYSDSAQAKLLTDGNVVLASSPLGSGPLQDTLSMIQQYSLDVKCTFRIRPEWSYVYFTFGYYKSQHLYMPNKTTDAAKLYPKLAPLAALNDLTLKADTSTIVDQAQAIGFLLKKINATSANKWPPHPGDPVIRELFAREAAIQRRTIGVYLRRRSAREPQGLKTFGALKPLVGQLHQAIETFMRSRDANNGSANLRQIASIVDAIKAKASEIR
jgi:hypothetical protein